MSAEFDLVVTAATGGAAGSIMAFILSYAREKRKENMLRKRARDVVTHELRSAKDFIQSDLLDSISQGKDTLYLSENDTKILTLDRKIETLQYPSMNTEIRLIAFDPELQGKLQDIYFKIKNMRSYQVISFNKEHKTFNKIIKYSHDYLKCLIEDIDKVIKMLNPTVSHTYIHPPE